MWIQKPGIVNDRLVFLGTRKNNIYLLKGEADMLIGGGCPWIVPDLMAQIQSWQIDMQRVKYLFVGHSHFDHCGAVPYLQKRYPHLKVVTSRQAAIYFENQKAVRNMRKFSRAASRQMDLPNNFEGISLDFDAISVTQTFQDGDRFDLGKGLVFRAFETPGHSRCAMVLYAEAQKWLFPTDAMAIPINDGWQFACTASESFGDYVNSLKRLVELDVRLCAWEHNGLMTGRHAQQIVQRVLRSTLSYKDTLKEHFEQTGDADATADWAASKWLAQTAFKFIPYEVMHYICRQMVRNAVAEDLAVGEL